MNDFRKIGVVTVTYNSATVLDDFLRALAEQTYTNFVVYAVDNASSDTTVKLLQAWGDARLRLIPNSANLGVAKGNNQGIRAALGDECDLILLLNNDVDFEPETFASLVNELDAVECDMLAPKILFSDRIHIQCAGGTFHALKGYFGGPIAEGEVDRGQHDSHKRIKNAPTCCLLIRKEVFSKIGMMDEKYFVYHDDSDFLFRAWRAGLVVYYTPRARVFHKVSMLTGGTKSPFSLRYSTRGHVYFMLKNLGILPCLLFLPALQLRMFMKLLVHAMDWKEFVIRQRAFFEGLSVWASRRN